MKNLVLKGLFPMVVVCLSPFIWAQSASLSGATEGQSVVPTLVNYSGTLSGSAANLFVTNPSRNSFTLSRFSPAAVLK